MEGRMPITSTNPPGYDHDNLRDTIYAMALQRLRELLFTNELTNAASRADEMLALMREAGFREDVIDAYWRLSVDLSFVYLTWSEIELF